MLFINLTIAKIIFISIDSHNALSNDPSIANVIIL